MPDQRLFFGLSKNVPQLLCLTFARIKGVHHSVEMFQILIPKVGDAVGAWISTGSQRRPHRRRHGGHGAQHRQIFSTGAPLDILLDMGQFSFTEILCCQGWVQTIDTQYQHFFT